MEETMALEQVKERQKTAARSAPPFHADHVGSLLRPPELQRAREQILGAHTAEANIAPHDNDQLRTIENRFIREAIAMQERVGLKAATDGELRRRSWMLELFLAWDGLTANRSGQSGLKWRNETGANQDMTEFRVTGPIRWNGSAIVKAFQFLRDNTKVVPKVGIPAPSVVHYFLADGGRLDSTGYKDFDHFWGDLIRAYRQEIDALVAAGATYIQIDDVCFAYLCDPVHRDFVKQRGNDPMRLLEIYADRINDAIAGLPGHVTIALHTCRGNREGQWVAEGAYDPVADILFNRLNAHAYFLEYDSDRAGGFGPLRYLPKDKIAVLGIVSSKRSQLEGADELTRRIEEAARVVDLSQLAISPQCGFASSYRGNPLTLADQEAKLRRLVEVAQNVWGEV
jgi:5-methyltetrahydropteroyltriglutamate--homocysteine methyltransferase